MTLRTSAIVLKRTNYSEADRIISFLTPSGQVDAIARGVRREKSKLAGGIELLGVSDITFHQGKGKLATVTSARLISFHSHILEDYDRLQFAYEALRLVNRSSKDIDGPEWFDILKTIFEFLDKPKVPQRLIELWFFLRYSAMLGEEMNLSADTKGEALAEHKKYFYNNIEKTFEEDDQGNITADHIKFLRLAAVKPLESISAIGGISSILDEAWLAARQQAGV